MLVSGDRLIRRGPPVRAAQESRRVAMVCMPFQEPGLPSVAVATLAASLRRAGHDVRVFHLHLDAAAALGLPVYHLLSRERSFPVLLGEWLFSHPSIAPGATDRDAYVRFLQGRDATLARLPLSTIRRRLDARLASWFASTDWGSFDVVGFSALFQQLNASLRLARAIKDRYPHVRVVFGGGAFEGSGGVALRRRHPWIDAVFSGYAERTLPAYVASLPAAPDPIEEAEGLPMDELPIPEYDDFFAALRDVGLERSVDVRVPIETSRGCWWGERHHCTFCGLNGLQMRFREKTAPRVVEEIERLRVHGRGFFALDSIMSKNFVGEVLPELARRRIHYDAFYEIKANVTRPELEAMRDVGITILQPGIESLSTSVLKTMRKGVTGVHNVWLLRASEELELTLAWNFLYGFPDEDASVYGPLAEMVPALAHLPPPVGPRPVQMVRFAPLYEDRDAFGARDVRPIEAYRHAFGPHEHLSDQAYVFDFAYGDGRRPDLYARAFIEAVRAWARVKQQPFAPRCEIVRVGTVRVLLDSRRLERVGRAWPRVRRVSDDEWAILDALSEPAFPETFAARFAGREAATRELLDRLERERLVLRLDERIVRLVVVRDHPGLAHEVARVARSRWNDLGARAREAWTEVRTRLLATDRASSTGEPVAARP